MKKNKKAKLIQYFGYKYYNSTYKIVTTYVLTPAEVVTKDALGNEVEGSYSYKYSADFVK